MGCQYQSTERTHHAVLATHPGVRAHGGALKIQDGPFANTREQLGGTFVIDVPDLDAAIAWAQRCPAAQYGSIEIRPSAITYTGGRWVYA